MSKRWPSKLWACALGVALLACGNESGLSPCDIRERDCQDDIYLAVQRVRGSGWDPWLDRTPMRVITAAEYAAELKAAELRGKALAEQQTGFDYGSASLELLRLLDPDREPSAAVSAQVGNVAAYYSYQDRAVTIIDHGTEGDLEGRTAILAHELVHAAQDRELGLFSFLAANTRDASFALRAIIEGEAVLYSNVVMLGIEGSLGLDDVDWLDYYDRMLSGSKQRVFEDASPEFQLYGMLYPLGTRLLTERYLRGGNAAVREMWANVPAYTRAVMSDAPSATRQALNCAPPEVPEGYRFISGNSFGALTLFGVATRVASDVEAAWQLSLAWRDDRVFVFGADDQTALLWQIRVASGQAASFAEKMAAFYGDEAVNVAGDAVLIHLQTEEEPLEYAGKDTCR